ncbi:Aldo/keto reductase [Suillus brevipes Sb2]|nr:Aldo/keto reductase [Suillus brevipes Sb2]
MPFGTVTLNDGNEFPVIAFGTGSAMIYKDVTDYVGQAIENGFSHIDTAQFYQTEAYVGLAIKESGLSRSSLYITTKYSIHGSPRQAIQQSLNKIGLSYVDLYLVHGPSLFSDFESGWQEFEKMKKDGLTRSIGVSNFNLENLQKLMKIAVTKPAVNQISFHPYNYASHKAMLEYCAKHSITVEAYGSLKTSRSKERLQEYLAVEDLPPLTAEEIAAIDDAGAKGPPSRLVVARLAMQHKFERSSYWVMWLVIAIMFGFATFLCNVLNLYGGDTSGFCRRI